jgi:hypothetical protein
MMTRIQSIGFILFFLFIGLAILVLLALLSYRIIKTKLMSGALNFRLRRKATKFVAEKNKEFIIRGVRWYVPSNFPDRLELLNDFLLDQMHSKFEVT